MAHIPAVALRQQDAASSFRDRTPRLYELIDVLADSLMEGWLVAHDAAPPPISKSASFLSLKPKPRRGYAPRFDQLARAVRLAG